MDRVALGADAGAVPRADGAARLNAVVEWHDWANPDYSAELARRATILEALLTGGPAVVEAMRAHYARDEHAADFIGDFGYCFGFDEGLAALQRTIDLSPQNADFWLRRSSALFSRGIIGEAMRHALRAVHLTPGLTDAHVLLGKLHASQGRMEQADECFQNALRMHPANAHTRISQAVMLERRGDFEAARSAVDSALLEIPKHPQLLLLLGRMAKTQDDRGQAISRIEKRLVDDPPLPQDTRAQLQFVLGGLHDREQNFEKAFAHLREANMYRRDTRPFDRACTAAEFRAIRNIFTAEFLRTAPRSHVDGNQMIFIVGMPRSGTSLTEQIIAAHSQAFGSGELTTLDRIARWWPDGDDTRPAMAYPAYVPAIDASGLTEIAYRYLNRLPPGARDHARVTDKMPYNFLHLGMIALLFPGARIVHCNRNPVDTTFSCYLQDFLEGNAFSNSLEDCGWFYNQYRSLMVHWRRVLPSYPIMELQYEELVADSESTVRRLLEFCGLDWDPACLSFHKSRRYGAYRKLSASARASVRTRCGALEGICGASRSTIGGARSVP